ncbi:thioredoxin [Actinopolyspora erythraea]|uniref:Thioredoxin n=1 Tax=Actinopolyspora erythraea TaxID=414996 RepID=A0A099DAF9_9ACTN|nr:thioredoxin family protein [Actinopolyspora erythraea]ASU80444.1 thioredoxin [Actinopolyspora erythraea]KGI82886.1 thioredoxin [Actinopolyspora erythraea]
MPPGWWALLGALLVTAVLGTALRAREGRITRRNNERGNGVDRSVFDQLPTEIAEVLRREVTGGAREAGTVASGRAHGCPPEVTLLQLSTTFCAPCRHTRVLLSTMAERTTGLRHVEIDLTSRPEWSGPLRVHTTPTTLALDPAGRELFRLSGVPRRDGLTEALRPHLP